MGKEVEFIQGKLLKCLFYTKMYRIVYTRLSGGSVPFILSVLTGLAFNWSVQGLLYNAISFGSLKGLRNMDISRSKYWKIK